MPDDALRLAEFVASEIRGKSPAVWLQGKRRPPFDCTRAEPVFVSLATYRWRGLPEAVAKGMLAHADGRRALHVLERVASPDEVLDWQSRGERCASILPEGSLTAPHEDRLAFLVHDLCHLEKFVEPEYFPEQVGFFSAMKRAWPMHRLFDDQWRLDLEHVACDMNGSCIFLFAALKMKLKMAVRRLSSPDSHGPLTPVEVAAYEPYETDMLRRLQLPDDLLDDARRVSTKHDHPASATRIRDYFADAGAAVLRCRATS